MTGIAINLLLLAVLVAYVLRRAWPATEAVRLRNALLLQPSEPADFTWTPPAFPAGFDVERREATPEFCAIVRGLGTGVANGDWNCALALAGHLTECAADRGPVQADLPTTYLAIRAGHGYCADFVKVFLAMAHAAGLSVRQWGFSFDGFGGHGHTVVEVFDRQRGAWSMLDVYNNFHLQGADGRPLGVLESRAALRDGGSPFALRSNGPGRPGFIHEHKALEYYRRGIDQWYLMWGNAVFSYYANPLVRCLGAVSRTLAHVAANLFGLQPGIRILASPANAEQVRGMFALRARLITLAWVCAVLLATLVVQVAWRSADVGRGQ